MSKDIRGDLYYIDPRGESWKITQQVSAQNGIQWYWHADTMRGEKAHRVSASMHRLLIGIDRFTRENGHDGDTENGQENSTEESTGIDAERSAVSAANIRGRNRR